MDIQQLKLLAGRIRALLTQHDRPIGHSQALDLIAAIPGLRDWPEVMSFPDRVNACHLESACAARLSYRLRKKHDLDLDPQALLKILTGDARPNRVLPQIWPTGPAPGVYVTTSQSAIDALIKRYEEASDGALIYAERAANGSEGSIDLGESGLWSPGLQRVPSGTLVVVGPIELNQEAWSSSAERMEMACLRAQVDGHRVAVLVETPTPEDVCEDLDLMVRSKQPKGDDSHAALTGIVTDDGELEARVPFAKARARPVQRRSNVARETIPSLKIIEPLRNLLADANSGLVLFGSAKIKEHFAADLVAASLHFTDHVGPAARVKPRNRGTPAKEWLVPDEIKELPYLPSIESAFDQGYRRIIYHPNYTDAEMLIEYADDALLISGAYGGQAADIYMGAWRATGIEAYRDLLARVLALFAVMPISTIDGERVARDLYVPPRSPATPLDRFDDVLEHIEKYRERKWQDELNEMLSAGNVTVAQIKESLPRDRNVQEFLKSLSETT